MEVNRTIKKDKLPVLITQAVISVLLFVLGVYNCIVNPDPLWISLIVFPLSIFLPHPQPPTFSSIPEEEERSDQDQVDGHTPASIKRCRQYRLRRILFACHICICILIIVAGICGFILLTHYRIVWVALTAFGVGCLLPTPLVLLFESNNGIGRCTTNA